MRKLLRFFAYQTSDGMWVAHCIDLSLAAQAESFDEVKQKLHDQVQDFCDYVNTLDDLEFRSRLLNRRAPLATRAHYWAAVLANKFGIGVHRGAPKRPRPWSERRQPITC